MIDPLSIGLGAVGIGSRIFSAIKGGQANRATQRLVDREQEANKARYNLSKNYWNTMAAKGAGEMIRKNQMEANKQVDNSTAVMGGTPEAEIAAKGAIQGNANEAMNMVGQQATNYELQKEQDFVNQGNLLNQQQIAINDAKAQQAQNLSANAENLINAAGFVNAMNEQGGNVAPAGSQSQVAATMPPIPKPPGIKTNPIPSYASYAANGAKYNVPLVKRPTKFKTFSTTRPKQNMWNATTPKP